MKLFVTKGSSFTCGGNIYTAGEEIPEGAFSDKSVLAKMISDGKIIEVDHSSEEIEEIKKLTNEALKAQEDAFNASKEADQEEIEELKAKLKTAEKALAKKGVNPAAGAENARENAGTNDDPAGAGATTPGTGNKQAGENEGDK